MAPPYVLTHIVVPTMGMIITLIMWSSPLKAFWEARRTRDLGPLNPIPSVCVLANCIGWFIYGLLKRDYFIFFSNVPGILIALFSIVTAMSIYSQHTKPFEELPEKYTQLEALLVVIFLLWCVVSLVAVQGFNQFADPMAQMQSLVGILSSFFAICYYGAPLSTMVEVIRTKDTSTMYGPMIVCNVANSFLWTCYGLAISDVNLAVPNGLGVVLGIVQLFVLFIYYKKPMLKVEEKTINGLTKADIESRVAVNPIRNEHFDDYLNEDGSGTLENYSKSSKERFHIG